jgi:hypothetical protein
MREHRTTFPPERWLDEHNARVANRIHAADVERFLRKEFGDDTQETDQ